MPKLLLVLFFVLIALPGFSQEEHDGGGSVTIRETPASENPEPEIPAEPVHDEDQALIDEATAVREERLEQVKAIEAATAPVAEAKNPIQQIHELGHEQINAATLMDDRVIAILQQAIRDGAMSQTSDEDTKKALKEKAKGTFLETVYKRSPKTLSICADILRSKEAIPGLLGIMARKEDLKVYGYIWIGIFIFGMWIKGKVVNPKWNFGKRFKYKSIISLVLSSISFGIFYGYFSQEIAPTFAIIGKHLF